MDLTIQAVSGLISTTGFADGPPVKAGPAVVDFLSGIHLYAAVITALFERERTGRGRLVAMQEAVYATLTSYLDTYWQSGRVPATNGQPQPFALAAQRLSYQRRVCGDQCRRRGTLASFAGSDG